MDRGIRSSGRRKVQWSLGTLMAVTATVAIVLAFVRPFAASATVRAARAVLDRHGPTVDPAFASADFVAETPIMTPSGFWQVRFVRVRGSGAKEHHVSVPPGAVRKARWNLWWRP